MRKRKSRHLHGGKLLTDQYSYSKKSTKRKVHRLFERLLKTVHDVFEDVIKLPRGERSQIPRPALLWPGGPNEYFGRNADNPLPNGTVPRFAYATGTGNNTIGINPTQRKIHAWLPEFDELWETVKPCLPARYHNTAWNAASMKFFDSFRDAQHTLTHVRCGLHCDVAYKKNGTAPGSSQIPGTPVLIMTFGGKKELKRPTTMLGHPPHGSDATS